jgi:tRNA(Arg) A34 adenosine deaminase TadA
MWDQLSTPWQVCLELSWQSMREGSLPVGSVITGPEGGIVARGRNRTGVYEQTLNQEIIGNPLAHAEINALLDLDYSVHNPRQLTLYTTVEPCPLCIGAICMAGIKHFHFAARDAWAGSVNLLNTTPYLRKKGITAQGPQNQTLETLIQVLQASSEVHHQHPNINNLLAVWAADHRHAVEVGVQLYESGKLRPLQRGSAPVAAVVELVLSHLGA